MNLRFCFGLTAAATSAIALIVSCTFPDVGFAERSVDASVDASVPQDDAASDGALVEATTRTDATAKIPDGSCLAHCDCDGDKYFQADCDSGAAPDAQFDCDDRDPLRWPNAQYSSAVPDDDQSPRGDWDCDQQTEKAYGVNLTCGLGSCGKKGFLDDPPCGTVADYFECQTASVLGCEPRLFDSRKQACK